MSSAGCLVITLVASMLLLVVAFGWFFLVGDAIEP
jgi:hypothetical protein